MIDYLDKTNLKATGFSFILESEQYNQLVMNCMSELDLNNSLVREVESRIETHTGVECINVEELHFMEFGRIVFNCDSITHYYLFDTIVFYKKEVENG